MAAGKTPWRCSSSVCWLAPHRLFFLERHNHRVLREAIAARQAAGDEAAVASLTEKEVAAYRAHRRELNDFTLAKLRGSAALYAASLRWDGDYRLEELAAAVREFAHRDNRDR